MLNMPQLQSLSIRELKDILLEELHQVEEAKRAFQKKKVDLLLNYKKIDVKAVKISTTIDFSLAKESIKQDLINRIAKARQQVESIKSITAKLGTLSFKEFESTFSAQLTDSRVVEILRNLHATEEEINDMLQILRGDEDYEDIRDAYNTYQVDKIIEEGGEVIPEEEAIDFFANRQQ